MNWKIWSLFFSILISSVVYAQRTDFTPYAMVGNFGDMKDGVYSWGGGTDVEIKISKKRGAGFQFFFVPGVNVLYESYNLEKNSAFDGADFTSRLSSTRLFVPLTLRMSFMPWAITHGKNLRASLEFTLSASYLLKSDLYERFDGNGFVFDGDITGLYERFSIYRTTARLPLPFALTFQIKQWHVMFRSYTMFKDVKVNDISSTWNLPPYRESFFFSSYGRKETVGYLCIGYTL